MNTHALEVLEYRAALEPIAARAASDVGADAVRRLEPSTSVDWVNAQLRLVAEGMELLRNEEGWIMPRIPSLVEALELLRLEGSVWEGPTLRQAADLIQAARQVRRSLLPPGPGREGLASEAERLAELPGAAEAILRAIDDDGAVRDEASPELRRIRREMQGARARIVGRLIEYTTALPPHYRVADASVSIREGRYVIPIRREGRGDVGGIVHGESQTGATLFVEPPVAIEMMNRLRELEGAEAREVHRILREQTDRLRPHVGDLTRSLDALVRIDTVYARAHYALASDAEVPEVLPPGSRRFEVLQGRHPLLLARGEAVVPFDLQMLEEERTLVISGPNTGGKTVLLKAIGLISLLAQSGVVPPVGARTRLPLFTGVYADIGDEQSIEASLSTFSAHLRNLRETLATADSSSLVLIDEIGSGTDPVEGGALAGAILAELTRREAFTVATTHLGALKLLAAADPSIVNASLQFDADRLQPTYRLVKGVPGRSYGLAIARRLGLPTDVLDSAEAALPQGERDVARLLLELEAKEQRVSADAAALEEELSRARALVGELEQRERELQRREGDAERRARQQARDLLMQSRGEVEAAIREVRGAADEEALQEAAHAARRRVEEAARRQRERAPPPATRPGRTGRSAGAALRVGGRVRIESLDRTGTVLELRENRAVVDSGGMRMQLATTDLTMLPAEEAIAAAPIQRQRVAGGRIDADLDARPEVDLRGSRVDEIELKLGRALDSAVLAGLPSFRIIHGKGTGALREQVQELVRRDPRVATFRPGDRFEGGTGVTIVEFG